MQNAGAEGTSGSATVFELCDDELNLVGTIAIELRGGPCPLVVYQNGQTYILNRRLGVYVRRKEVK